MRDLCVASARRARPPSRGGAASFIVEAAGGAGADPGAPHATPLPSPDGAAKSAFSRSLTKSTSRRGGAVATRAACATSARAARVGLIGRRGGDAGGALRPDVGDDAGTGGSSRGRVTPPPLRITPFVDARTVWFIFNNPAPHTLHPSPRTPHPAPFNLHLIPHNAYPGR